VWEGKARHYNRKYVKRAIFVAAQKVADAQRAAARKVADARSVPPREKNCGIPLRAAQYCTKIQSDPVPTKTNMLKLTARQEQILNLIKEAIDNTGFPPTRAEIAQELGFRSANAAEEHLQALARKGAIEISPGTSRGIRLVGQGAAESRASSFVPPVPPNLMSLPLVGRVAAGSPILAQEHVEATYSVDPAMFSSKPDFLLKVKGWSMRDAGICDGDFLAVKKVDNAKNGQIVVARIGDEVTVKRYRKTGATIELLPENPDFSVITVDPSSDEFALEGLAVGLLRSWH
jgi:repressor LexA